MNKQKIYRLGIDIGSTTVKIAVLNETNEIIFSDYQRHFANIQQTLAKLLENAENVLGQFYVYPVITGSGGLTLANHLGIHKIKSELDDYKKAGVNRSTFYLHYQNTNDLLNEAIGLINKRFNESFNNSSTLYTTGAIGVSDNPEIMSTDSFVEIIRSTISSSHLDKI